MNEKILPTNQEISNTLQQKTNNNERGRDARNSKRDIGKSEDNNHRNKSNYDSKNRNIKKTLKKVGQSEKKSNQTTTSRCCMQMLEVYNQN